MCQGLGKKYHLNLKNDMPPRDKVNLADIFAFVTVRANRLKNVDKEKKSTMKGFVTNDQADYYSGITSITINGKNAYELKGKFLDDLHNNAFSSTNGEDTVEPIEYFLKIVDSVDLPNVNHDKLRVVVFPISLVGDACRCDKVEPTNEKNFDLEETNRDDEQKIGEIFRIKTNLFDYETSLCEKFNKFNYLLKIDLDVLVILWDSRLMTNTRMIGFMNGTKTYHGYTKNHEMTLDWREDGYCNGRNLPGSYIVGNTLRYQDLEWYDALKDSELKEEALRNKDIMEGLINEDVESNNEDDGRYELCGNETHDLPVCTVRRFKRTKYSFGQEEEYVAVEEDEYEDLTSTSENACRAYQLIFRMIDEGWMGLAERKEIDNVGGESTIWKF
nr:hypothetical protein [Tanacetum cinerariifolium]